MHHITATIKRQGKEKTGQGFSPNELKAAGVNRQVAAQMGIRVDMRRKTCHQENVDTIKAHMPKPKA